MAPLTTCLGWRCPRVMCLSSRHSWFRARCCPSQGGLYIWRHGNIEPLSIDFKLGWICAWSVCRRVVRQLHVNRTCTEHETILKAKALRLSNAHVPPLSPASCVLRSCMHRARDDSEGQGTKIVQCSCPTLVSRLLCASLVRPEPLRCHCGYGRDLTPKPLYRVACKTTTSPSPVRGESSVWR